MSLLGCIVLGRYDNIRHKRMTLDVIIVFKIAVTAVRIYVISEETGNRCNQQQQQRNEIAQQSVRFSVPSNLL